MGYCMQLTNSDFRIKRENFDNALKALKALFIPENMTCTNTYNFDGVTVEEEHFQWVNTKVALNSKNLEEMLKEIRYSPIYDDKHNNIVNVEFTGHKYGDEYIFFEALAPFVESGSYLLFKGETGDMWVWLFDKKHVWYHDWPLLIGEI